MIEALLFYFAAAVAIAGAGAVVLAKSPLRGALALVVSLCGVAMLFLLLNASFIAAMQILVYAGAIMVLFVFVIMLLTLKDEELGQEPAQKKKVLAAVGAIMLLFVLAYSLAQREGVEFRQPVHEAATAKLEADTGKPVPRKNRVDFGSTEHFGRFLYTDYVVPFELITVLVMAAVAGVITMARRPDSASLERTKLTGGPS